MKSSKKRRLYIIVLTGLSGAGKTVVLNAFEDSNYFCVDNLPASLIKTFVHLCYKSPDISKIAIGVDIREKKFFPDLTDTISSLKKTQDVEIIFIEARDNVLIRRFKETRRPHPLGYRDIRKAIHKERTMLSNIKNIANRVIDSSSFSPHQLRKVITQIYSDEKMESMAVSLISFGYKYGIPTEADLLFDVRFLPNPNFVQGLKPFNGMDTKVKNYVLGKKDTKQFFTRLFPLLEFLIQRYGEEGRNYLTIGIGCTGGRHRSPAIVEEIRKVFKKQKLHVSVIHRDMNDIHG